MPGRYTERPGGCATAGARWSVLVGLSLPHRPGPRQHRSYHAARAPPTSPPRGPSCLPSSVVYMNTGASAPAARAADALGAWAPRRRCAQGRGAAAGFGRTRPRAVACGPPWAGWWAPGGEGIALTANTTEGLNVAAWGIDWRPGDEIIMPALEYPGGPCPGRDDRPARAARGCG